MLPFATHMMPLANNPQTIRESIMSKSEKPIAKSLHTISVIVQVSRFIRDNDLSLTREQALEDAIVALELNGKPDVYGLKSAALKQLYK